MNPNDQQAALLKEIVDGCWDDDVEMLKARATDVLKAATPPAADAGAVGSLTISRWKGIDAMVNHDFDYLGDLPDGTYSLYTRPGPITDGSSIHNVNASDEK